MKTDLTILGGGLAGLAAGIIAVRAGYSVVLIEKKEYPFHKVCGEYISKEAEPLLRWLGVPVEEWALPVIQRFGLSHPNGRYFQSRLPLGGLGVSRYKLDAFLMNQLKAEGGIVLDGTKATGCQRTDTGFEIQTTHPAINHIESIYSFGSFGRNKPDFAQQAGTGKPGKEYFGVKYHLQGDFPKDKIELHHFPGGYCGISAVEDDRLCFCYLLYKKALSKFKGNFDEIESVLLCQNPNLKHFLNEFKIQTPRVTTSGVHFNTLPLNKNGMLFLGDSAGMIPPLAGNGMSMALHSAVLAVQSLGKENYVNHYENQWKSAFSTRLKTGRVLQSWMENDAMIRLSMTAFSAVPAFFRMTVRQTHGISIPIPEFSDKKV